jgi:hypothetical protein
VITGGEPTVSDSVAFPVPYEFVAPSATLEDPEEVGVPVIKPVDALRESPVGSPVAE